MWFMWANRCSIAKKPYMLQCIQRSPRGSTYKKKIENKCRADCLVPELTF